MNEKRKKWKQKFQANNLLLWVSHPMRVLCIIQGSSALKEYK